MLNLLSNEADPCCERAFLAIIRDGGDIEGGVLESGIDRFECPVCCCEYRPRIEGALRYWEYFGFTALLRAVRRA